MGELARELGVGAHFERPASLLALKQALAARGLQVEGYRDATIQEIVAALDGSGLWLLHVKTGADGPAHYYVVAGRDPKRVAWIDAGNFQEWLSGEELGRKVGPRFSGWCLRVAGPNAVSREHVSVDGSPGAVRLGARKAPVVWFPQQVDLGIVPVDQLAKIRVDVVFVFSGYTEVTAAGCSPGLELVRETARVEACSPEQVIATRMYSFRLTERATGPIRESLVFQSSVADLGPVVIPVKGELRSSATDVAQFRR